MIIVLFFFFCKQNSKRVLSFLKIQDGVRQITTQGENKYRVEQKKGSQKMLRWGFEQRFLRFGSSTDRFAFAGKNSRSIRRPFFNSLINTHGVFGHQFGVGHTQTCQHILLSLSLLHSHTHFPSFSHITHTFLLHTHTLTNPRAKDLFEFYDRLYWHWDSGSRWTELIDR